MESPSIVAASRSKIRAARTTAGKRVLAISGVICGTVLLILGFVADEVVFACDHHALCSLPKFPFPFTVGTAAFAVWFGGLVLVGFGIFSFALPFLNRIRSGRGKTVGRED
jgi:hypothetical protein